jgi:hypothetical protein
LVTKNTSFALYFWIETVEYKVIYSNMYIVKHIVVSMVTIRTQDSNDLNAKRTGSTKSLTSTYRRISCHNPEKCNTVRDIWKCFTTGGVCGRVVGRGAILKAGQSRGSIPDKIIDLSF